MLGNFRKYKPARKVRQVRQVRGSSSADVVTTPLVWGVACRSCPFAVNWWRGEACGVGVDAVGVRADSGSAWTGSYGARRWTRGRKCGKVRRAAGGWWTGDGAFVSAGVRGRTSSLFRLEGGCALTAVVASWAVSVPKLVGYSLKCVCCLLCLLPTDATAQLHVASALFPWSHET